MNGLLVALEGIDGAGKTTLCRELVRLLSGGCAPGVTGTKQPTHSIYRARVMNGCVTASTADRALHAAQVINPALERGEIVICDRYYGSADAYAIGDYESMEVFHDQEKVFANPHVWIHVCPDLLTSRARVLARGEEWDGVRMYDVSWRFYRLFENLECDGRSSCGETILHHRGGDTPLRNSSCTWACADAIRSHYRAINGMAQ